MSTSMKRSGYDYGHTGHTPTCTRRRPPDLPRLPIAPRHAACADRSRTSICKAAGVETHPTEVVLRRHRPRASFGKADQNFVINAQVILNSADDTHHSNAVRRIRWRTTMLANAVNAVCWFAFTVRHRWQTHCRWRNGGGFGLVGPEVIDAFGGLRRTLIECRVRVIPGTLISDGPAR